MLFLDTEKKVSWTLFDDETRVFIEYLAPDRILEFEFLFIWTLALELFEWDRRIADFYRSASFAVIKLRKLYG